MLVPALWVGGVETHILFLLMWLMYVNGLIV